MPLAHDLMSLQALDDEAASHRATIGDIEHRLAGDAALDAARAELAAAAGEREELRRARRRLEGDLATLDTRIAAEEKRLYDGTIKNPKELVALQHEVDALKQSRSRLEDELLAVLDLVEASDTRYEAASASLVANEARWAGESDALRAGLERQLAALTRAEARRAAAAASLPPAALRQYEAIRSRRGSAVARISGSLCSACRVTIPDALRTRAQLGTALVQCPNCERILVGG
jgi:predicted  nucleic acid-binding Zn-ribbon protein